MHTEAPKLLSFDDAGFPRLKGHALRLPPKERAVLALLARNQPGAVSKQQFASAAWTGRLMSDESPARCIRRRGRVLAPAGLRIESVYGTGYRLEGAAPPAGGPATAAPSGAALETYQQARQLALQPTPVAVQRATGMLRLLIAQHPGFVPAKVALADVLAAAIGWGRVDTDRTVEEGLQLLAEARRQQPQAPGLDASHGALLDAAWRFEDAGLAFEQALRHDGENPETLLAYSRHLLLIDRAPEAVTQLQAALRRSPYTPLLHMILARALAQSGQGALAVAEADAAV